MTLAGLREAERKADVPCARVDRTNARYQAARTDDGVLRGRLKAFAQ